MEKPNLEAIRAAYLEELRQARDIRIAITADGQLKVSGSFQLSGWATISDPKLQRSLRAGNRR